MSKKSATFPFKISSAVVCEDIRQEISKKFLLIGVFGGEANVGVLPGVIQLALFVELIPKSTGAFDVQFRIMDDQDRLPVEGNVQFSVADGSSFGAAIGPFPVAVHSPGTIRFQWRTADVEWDTVRTIKLNLNPAAVAASLNPSPTASPPLPSQSLPDAPAS
jgi:hypothetical protein